MVQYPETAFSRKLNKTLEPGFILLYYIQNKAHPANNGEPAGVDRLPQLIH